MLDPEERLRMSLHESPPPPLDAGPIIAGARRTRARRRAAVASGVVSLAVVAGAGVLAVNQIGSNGVTSAAPRSDAQTGTATDRAASVEQVELTDGLVATGRGDGFCVTRLPERTVACHTGPGSLVVQGTTRRWLVFGGPAHPQGYQYEQGGSWLPMDWRAATRASPQAYAFAPDPAGEGPFRVRRAKSDSTQVWVG